MTETQRRLRAERTSEYVNHDDSHYGLLEDLYYKELMLDDDEDEYYEY